LGSLAKRKSTSSVCSMSLLFLFGEAKEMKCKRCKKDVKKLKKELCMRCYYRQGKKKKNLKRNLFKEID
jgi:hypothetical protein